ncbi:ATP synthase subunit I [Schlesneria sp. DSM 10557]|uniref:N-ATPase subunit AtpR n=1 Tax=Schlesneria sp. DSM 10557 TaxID=3044399 RepID=UPI0035A0762E
MTTLDFIYLVLAFGAGLAVGLLYFGGLWLTIQQLPRTRMPVLLVMTSAIIRTLVTIGVFYLIMGDRWERAIACLVGFITMRLFWVASVRSLQASESSIRKEEMPQ